MESTSSNNWNPAETANGKLEQYLPALGYTVKQAYAMYSFDSFQLAELIGMIENATAARYGDLATLERQLIPLLNTVRAQMGKPPIIAPRTPPPEGDC